MDLVSCNGTRSTNRGMLSEPSRELSLLLLPRYSDCLTILLSFNSSSTIIIFEDNLKILKLIEHNGLLQSATIITAAIVLIINKPILSLRVGYGHASEDLGVAFFGIGLSLGFLLGQRFQGLCQIVEMRRQWGE